MERAVFEDNMEVKEACMGSPRRKKAVWHCEIPVFTVFYLNIPMA